MSISASKCPFFTSTIEIVRNLKISKLQLAICQTYHISSFFAKVKFVVQVKIVTSALISSVFVVQIKLVTSAFPTCMKFRVCILSGNCHRLVDLLTSHSSTFNKLKRSIFKNLFNFLNMGNCHKNNTDRYFKKLSKSYLIKIKW